MIRIKPDYFFSCKVCGHYNMNSDQIKKVDIQIGQYTYGEWQCPNCKAPNILTDTECQDIFNNHLWNVSK